MLDNRATGLLMMVTSLWAGLEKHIALACNACISPWRSLNGKGDYIFCKLGGILLLLGITYGCKALE